MPYEIEAAKLRAWTEPYWRSISLQYERQDSTGIYIGAPMQLTKITPENEMERLPPTMTLHPDAAQILMDDLWRCGLRPSEGTGSAGALKATQNHLEDMRRLVMARLLPKSDQPPK